MRALILFILLTFAAPATAGTRVSLLPFESGLSFTPESPRAIQADHPLFRRIELEETENMPGRIGSFLTPITKPSEFNEALRSTLASANMLAETSDTARARLRVVWRQFELPFRISISSKAMVAIYYELSRLDNGQVIFSREIVTHAEARGGDGSTRARGTGRAAILANIASVTLCLQKAAFGQDPSNCALQTVGSFSAPITVAIPVYR